MKRPAASEAVKKPFIFPTPSPAQKEARNASTTGLYLILCQPLFMGEGEGRQTQESMSTFYTTKGKGGNVQREHPKVLVTLSVVYLGLGEKPIP